MVQLLLSHTALSPSIRVEVTENKDSSTTHITELNQLPPHCSQWRRCWMCHESPVTLIAQDLVRRVSIDGFTAGYVTDIVKLFQYITYYHVQKISYSTVHRSYEPQTEGRGLSQGVLPCGLSDTRNIFIPEVNWKRSRFSVDNS